MTETAWEVWEQSTALKAVEQPMQRGRAWSFKKQKDRKVSVEWKLGRR